MYVLKLFKLRWCIGNCQFAIFRTFTLFYDITQIYDICFKRENKIRSTRILKSNGRVELSLLRNRITSGYGLQTCVHCVWKRVGSIVECHGRF